MKPEVDAEDRAALQRALRVFELFRSIDPGMTMGAMSSFLAIAESSDGLSVTDVKRATGLSLTAASRHAHYLGKVDRYGNKGLELIAESVSYEDSRKKVLTPTPRGELVITQLSGLLRTGANGRGARRQKAPVLEAPSGN